MIIEKYPQLVSLKEVCWWINDVKFECSYV